MTTVFLKKRGHCTTYQWKNHQWAKIHLTMNHHPLRRNQPAAVRVSPRLVLSRLRLVETKAQGPKRCRRLEVKFLSKKESNRMIALMISLSKKCRRIAPTASHERKRRSGRVMNHLSKGLPNNHPSEREILPNRKSQGMMVSTKKVHRIAIQKKRKNRSSRTHPHPNNHPKNPSNSRRHLLTRAGILGKARTFRRFR